MGLIGNPVEIGSGPAAVSPLHASPLARHWEILPGRPRLVGRAGRPARVMADVLTSGRDAAFITLGDPLLYSTFGYVLPLLRERLPGVRIEVVPGITSFQAAAALTETPLAVSGENLLVASGVGSPDRLERALAVADNAVILKTYRRFPALRDRLQTMGLAKGTIFVTRLGLPGEAVERDLEKAPDAPHYLSLCLIKRPGK